MWRRLRHNLGALVSILLFGAALWVLWHELRAYRFRELVAIVAQLPADRIALAVALTILNYLVLTGYDALALRAIKHPLPYRQTALAAFLATTFSFNLGFPLLSGLPIRYRLYGAWGMSTVEITGVVAFISLTVWLGFCLLAGIAFIVEPLALPPVLRLPFVSIRVIGVGLLALVAVYILWSIQHRGSITVHGWTVALPSPQLALGQLVLSMLDWALVASVLYLLLPPAVALSYPGFLGIFLLAQIAGVASQLPGGLGVFESVMVVLLTPAAPTPAVIGALVAYRGIYYLLPLVVAVVLLGLHEIRARRAGSKCLTQRVGAWGHAHVRSAGADQVCRWRGAARLGRDGAVARTPGAAQNADPAARE